MNRKHQYMWLLVALLGLALGSCKGSDDDEIVVTDQCYLKSFTLGQLRRAMHVTGSQGQDSVYYASFAGQSFPMVIDQREGTVSNPDSLPYGTRVDAVLATLTFEGVCAYRPADLTAEDDSLWTPYSATDSIDFRRPMDFVVIATNGASARHYRVKVNVHRQEGDSTQWSREPDAAPLAAMGMRRAFALADRLIVLGQTPTGIHRLALVDTLWDEQPTQLPADADLTHIQQRGDTLYASDAAGRILRSTDGLAWTAAGRAPSRLTLCGATATRLYGIGGDTIFSTADLNLWTPERTDDATAPLPAEAAQSLSYKSPNGLERLLLVGYADGLPVTYMKTWGSPEAEQRQAWFYYTPNGADLYRLPYLKQLTLLRYDDGIIALGAGMKTILYSPDHGITYRPHATLRLTTEIQAATAASTNLNAAVDTLQRLYLIADTQVWRGRLARLAFQRQDR